MPSPHKSKKVFYDGHPLPPVPRIEIRPATPAEKAAAEKLRLEAVAALQRYRELIRARHEKSETHLILVACYLAVRELNADAKALEILDRLKQQRNAGTLNLIQYNLPECR